MHATPNTKYRKDYQVSAFCIDKTELTFTLAESHVLVEASLHIRRNPSAQDQQTPLVLNGHQLDLERVQIDGRDLSPKNYSQSDEALSIAAVPSKGFVLYTRVRIEPQNNSTLMGLYRSRALFCTQNEPEGFRNITYYLDRPDVMSEFTTTIYADKQRYPVLLANGNCIDQGDDHDGQHWATWHDPFKKPAHLFALVAGDLACMDDCFVTASGREVALKIFAQDKDLPKCEHAMLSLKQAMAWDEKVYGREYDLDIFMIVAVDDFNFGAMENKGLNIFSTACLLAHPDMTTDEEYKTVATIVAHEYFHNWSGNRVNCRDWFQLSLKEGLTVFRDAGFRADHYSAAVSRVNQAIIMRSQQFPEDAGPMAHPVQPESFVDISNFYTRTVYEKGAELVGMLHTLLGAEGFRQGCDLYFDRHDGEAVTIDDFVAAMEAASGIDLTQFRHWYHQAGTSVLSVREHYNADQRTYTLDITQRCPATPECQHKQPFVIPLSVALFGRNGRLSVEGTDDGECLTLTKAKQQFCFSGVAEHPTPSLLRHFSAPVKLDYTYRPEQLLQLMLHESDGFSRWDASQHLLMLALDGDSGSGLEELVQGGFRQLLREAQEGLNTPTVDLGLLALMLSLPSYQVLADRTEQIDVDAIDHSRRRLHAALARALEPEFKSLYLSLRAHEGAYQPNAEGMARRSLQNVCLEYLMRSDESEALVLCQQQIARQHNMTDVLAALTALVNSESAQAQAMSEKALNDFYQQWQHEPLMVDKWLALQATCERPGLLPQLKALSEGDIFDAKNPGKVRALIGGFSRRNPVNFHQPSGEGYRFLAEQVVRLDALNPLVAARMVEPLIQWRRYDTQRQRAMCEALDFIHRHEGLSQTLTEVMTKGKA